MAGYNRTREVEELLQRTESQPPSFTVHLHPEYWVLNNGSKFLYNNHIASLLDDIRAHRIPVDFLELFDTARVPYYDGCMIVELLDYRQQKHKDLSPDKPDRTRVVLHPDSETLWADICLLNKKHGQTWTDMDALEVEARILLATTPPLCLDPNPHLTRIANHVLRVSTPAVPTSLKRKAAELEREEDEVEKTRRHKLMSFMNPRPNTSHAPSYRILDTLKRLKQEKEAAPLQPQQTQPNIPIPNLSVNTTVPAASLPAPASTQPSLPSSPQKPTVAIKKEASERASNSPHPGPSATPLPQPHPQLNPPAATSSPAAASPASHQPTTNGHYTNGAEAAHRTPTPSQPSRYTQSPRMPQTQPIIPVARPPSSQPVQPPRPQSRPPSQPQPQPQPIPRPPTTQPQAPFPANATGHFVPGSPAMRQAKVATPQPPPQTHQATQAQLLYMQQYYEQQQRLALASQQQAIQHQQQQQQQKQQQHPQHQLQQQQQQNGRATPQGTQAAAASAANRGSPRVANQPVAARSMTPQGGQTVQFPPHLAQHIQQSHLRQNPQYAAHMAAPPPGMTAQQQQQHQQQQQAQAQAHLQAAAAVAAAHQGAANPQLQQQQQVAAAAAAAQGVPLMTYPQQMYNFQQMPVGIVQTRQGMQGVPSQSYWVAAGRMPGMVNGHGQPIPGMPQGMGVPGAPGGAANAQALGVQKAAAAAAGQTGQAR